MPLKCFHQLFEAQIAAGKMADMAIGFAVNVVTYDVFNRRANQLARHLMARGVGPDCPVGLFMAPTPELFISIIAIAKAGGAYVPLNTDETQERIAVMVADCSIHVVIVGAGGQQA